MALKGLKVCDRKVVRKPINSSNNIPLLELLIKINLHFT